MRGAVGAGEAMVTVSAARADLSTPIPILSACTSTSVDSGMLWKGLGGDMTMTLSVWRCSGRCRLGGSLCKQCALTTRHEPRRREPTSSRHRSSVIRWRRPGLRRRPRGAGAADYGRRSLRAGPLDMHISRLDMPRPRLDTDNPQRHQPEAGRRSSITAAPSGAVERAALARPRSGRPVGEVSRDLATWRSVWSVRLEGEVIAPRPRLVDDPDDRRASEQTRAIVPERSVRLRDRVPPVGVEERRRR